MSTERDTGLEALQRGDNASAISLLEQACQIEPNDFLSHLYLGAAYGQSNRHDEAVHSITRAVQIDPSSASARFNLGIALEHAGWPTEAITVFQQALVLQPDYPKASEALARLQGSSPQAGVIHNPVPIQPQTPPQLSGLGSYQSGGEDSQTNYGAPSAAYGSQHPLPGTQQPIPAFQPPTGGMPGASPYGASPYPAANNSGFNMRPVYEDSFSLGQAWKDWISVLKSPTKFFEDQVDREGLKAPMAMIVFYILLTLPSSLIGAALASQNIGSVLVKQLIAIPFMIIAFLVIALFIHSIGKMFGNSAAFSGSYRALVYSYSPFCLVGLISALIAPSALAPLAKTQPAGGSASVSQPQRLILVQSTTNGQDNQMPQGTRRGRMTSPSSPYGQKNSPGMPGSSDFPGAQQNPFGSTPMPTITGGLVVIMILGVISLIWNFILQVMGISTIQRISTGAAVGTIIISNIILFVIFFVFMVVAGFAIAAMFMGSGAIH